MNHSENVDHESVLRARAILLGSGRIDLHQEIRAYRVLARVGPLTYLPKLARALLTLAHQEYPLQPEIQLKLTTEAVAAAREVDPSEPKRTELLISTLDSCQRQLYTSGRRAEGLALREEMARLGRRAFAAGEVASPVFGCGQLAAGLAEEGRHREAARLYGEIVEAERSEDDRSGTAFWSGVAWAAELDAAGLHDAAIDAFTDVTAGTRKQHEADRTSTAILVWDLVRLSQMLAAQERHEEAGAARREAGALLEELAESGERKSWSNILSWWLILLGLSGRADEPPAGDEPAPPFGSHLGWSPDVRQAYFDGRAALEETVAVLTTSARNDPHRHLTELVTQQRRLTIRSAVHQGGNHYRFMETLRPRFDEGVELARRSAALDEGRGTALLARALTDRSTLFVAGHQYAQARDDFQEAADLLGQERRG